MKLQALWPLWSKRLVGIAYHAVLVPNDSRHFVGAFVSYFFACSSHAFLALFSRDITTAEVDAVDGELDRDLDFVNGVGGGKGRVEGAKTVEFEVVGGVQGEGSEHRA